MLKPLTFVALTAISSAPVTSVIAQDEPQFASEIASLTPQLETVLSGGHWTRGDIAGTFRLIIRAVGFERIRNELYLQWIQETSDPYRPYLIERTIPIPEIDGWRVTGQRLAFVKKQWKIIVDAERENAVEVKPKTDRRYFIIVPSGDYGYHIAESPTRPSI